MKRAVLGAALFLCVAGIRAEPGREFERGFPPIEVQSEKHHGVGAQLFSVAQDAAGMIYVGALGGIGVYDGAWWNRIALPNDSAVFSVAGGRGPEVAVGGIDEFGWAAAGANGSVEYHSLLGHLPPERRRLGDVRSICAIDSGFLYVAERAVILWTGGAPRIIADVSGRTTAPPRCFRAGATTYVALDDGLHRVAGNALVPAGYAHKRVDLVLPLDDTRTLTIVRGEAIHLNGTPFAAAASAWLRDKIVTAGCVLKDGRIVIATRQDGVAILDRRGDIEQRLDTNAGLPDAVLTAALTDREGSLWLAYYGSIARVDLDTPMSLIDRRRGVRGSPNSAQRHAGRVYITTSHGLFVLNEDGTTHNIAGIPAPAWRVISADDALLVGTGDGVFVLGDDGVPRRIRGTESLSVYHFEPSSARAQRWWLATKQGVAMLERDARGWRYGGLVARTPPYTRRVIDQRNVLWIGSVFDGVTRVDLSVATGAPARSSTAEAAVATPRIRTYGTGELDAVRIGDRIVVVAEGRLLEPRPDGTLAPDPLLGHIRGDFHVIEEDIHGNVWLSGGTPGIVRRLPNGRFAQEPLPLVGIDARVKELNRDGDVMWLSASTTLYRIEAARQPRPMPQPPPLIRRAVTADGTPVARPLPHSFGRLHIEFAPASYRPGIAYQYRLDPADEAWSAWTSEPRIDYTNLDSGEYTFRVRARGAAGQISAETQRSFVVLPPWYRTPLAIALWVLVAGILIAMIVRLRTAALRRQAERLRMLVHERTEDLQQANAHLERLSLLDDLTGIANRRYFQRALVEDWRVAHENRQPLALLLLDLDRFKQLNDEHGHPAGDAALVHVARFLSREIRRSGELGARLNDLVARIGGEEFAVVLTSTSEEEAMRVGETLRAGIEALPIPIRSSATIFVTASVGVASIVPQITEGWNALMQEADRALYDAKAAGRNCVRAASATPRVAKRRLS